MTGYERISNIINHKPVDRLPVFEHFWEDTYTEWRKKGFIKEEESFEDHFNLDMQNHWTFNMTANLDFEPEVIEETEETILVKDGNGAFLRRHKLHDSTPEHVDFTVKNKAGWEEHIKPYLTIDERRIDFEGYRKAKAEAKKANRFFCWSGVNVFELMHPVCGHEYMLMGMVLEPEWIQDMVTTYSRLVVELQKILFDREGYPDGIFYYEDMGFKEKPFFSPDFYKKLIQPGHIYTIDYAHSNNIPVIMHSCGYVEPLLPGMIESGIDCLQVIEIKAGMDLLKLYEEFGDKIAFMGGIDVRKLYTNDKKIIDQELENKIPNLKKKFSYVIHSDHSIPKTVDYSTFTYYLEKAIELGTYDC